MLGGEVDFLWWEVGKGSGASAGPSECNFLFLAAMTLCVDSSGLAVEVVVPRTRERGTLGTAARYPFLVGAGGDEERLFAPEDSLDEVGWAAVGFEAT